LSTLKDFLNRKPGLRLGNYPRTRAPAHPRTRAPAQLLH
jgi:hypothetical protein